MENNNNSNGQLSLLAFGGLEPAVLSVFTQVEKKDETGEVTSQQLKIGNRRDIGKLLKLTAKTDSDKLTAAILDARDGLKPKIIELVTRLMSSPDWSPENMRAYRNKKGVMQFALKASEVKHLRKTGMDDAKVAAFYGISVEELQAMRARQIAKQSAIDVQADLPKTDEATDEQVAMEEAKLMAALQAEEAALAGAQVS